MVRIIFIAAGLALAMGSGAARAQTAVTPYGMPIGLDDAKKAAAAAEAEVAKAGSPPDAIAIVDPGGHLIYFERMDNTQLGSLRIAIDKARSAALFRRPTKVFQDAVAGGRTMLLGLRGAVPVEGGLPLVASGKVVGAIGASGGTGAQDGEVAKAGADTVK
jgi:uncharacterized protein GlcG (DUF336 family)